MAAATSAQPKLQSLNDPEFKKRLQELRQTDNYRNWFYVVRTYALFALVIGGAVSFYHFTRAGGASIFWNVPVFFAAIMIVGALQHHLANLAHEAVHHTLFKNRYLNDLASEWFCSFPMFSSTFHYGLHHLAHHQFVNDPIRDPDISQLQKSGHRLSFPVVRDEFLDVLFRQMWVPNLVRYSMARTEYDSLGTVHNPYIREDWEYTKLPARLSGRYLAGIALAALRTRLYGNALLLAVVPLAAWAVIHDRAAGTAGAQLLPEQNSPAVFDAHARDDAGNVSDCWRSARSPGRPGPPAIGGRVLAAAMGCTATDYLSAVHGAPPDRAARQRRPRLAYQQPRVPVPSVHQFRGVPAGPGLSFAAPHVFHDPALPAESAARADATHSRIPRSGHGRRRLLLAERATANAADRRRRPRSRSMRRTNSATCTSTTPCSKAATYRSGERREILAEGAREAERVRQRSARRQLVARGSAGTNSPARRGVRAFWLTVTSTPRRPRAVIKLYSALLRPLIEHAGEILCIELAVSATSDRAAASTAPHVGLRSYYARHVRRFGRARLRLPLAVARLIHAIDDLIQPLLLVGFRHREELDSSAPPTAASH